MEGNIKEGFEIDSTAKKFMDDRITDMPPEDMDSSIISVWQDRACFNRQSTQDTDLLSFVRSAAVSSDHCLVEH